MGGDRRRERTESEGGQWEVTGGGRGQSLRTKVLPGTPPRNHRYKSSLAVQVGDTQHIDIVPACCASDSSAVSRASTSPRCVAPPTSAPKSTAISLFPLNAWRAP